MYIKIVPVFLMIHYIRHLCLRKFLSSWVPYETQGL